MAARPYFLLSAATTNFTYLGTANLVSGYVINTNAASRYIKFYNAPQSGAVPVVGTTVPFLTVLLTASVGTPLENAIPDMQALQSSGPLWMATTTGVAFSDTAAVGAGDLYIHLGLEG
jgi:hypothetical protein